MKIICTGCGVDIAKSSMVTIRPGADMKNLKSLCLACIFKLKKKRKAETAAREAVYIKVDDLEVGEAYFVNGRNFQVAIWDGIRFNGVRSKWGDVYMSTEEHWDIDNGTVKPIARMVHPDET